VIYNLYVKVDGHWQWASRIEADSHPAALRQAISHLDPEHYAKPIRLECDDPPDSDAKP
jgi:hypothetical protein